MAVIRNSVIVSPSVDTMTSAELDSITIEPGTYLLNSSKTIGDTTSSKWAIQCISDNDATSPTCYVQLWTPAENGLTDADHIIYVRTLNAAGTAWGNFSSISGGSNNAVENESSYPTSIYIQSQAPTPVSGTNIIWIDNS